MTPLRSIRVSNDLWQAVKIKANANGFTVTKVVIYYLKEYLKED
jgi:predicted DNA binding CopG/RHH family protein